MCSRIFGLLDETSLPLIFFPELRTMYAFEDDMAPKNVVPQSSGKAVRSISKESTIASATSSKVMIRNMVKANMSITLKKQVVALILQSHETLAPPCLMMKPIKLPFFLI